MWQKDHKKENNLNSFIQSQTHSYFEGANIDYASGLSTCTFGLDYMCAFLQGYFRDDGLMMDEIMA